MFANSKHRVSKTRIQTKDGADLSGLFGIMVELFSKESIYSYEVYFVCSKLHSDSVFTVAIGFDMQ